MLKLTTLIRPLAATAIAVAMILPASQTVAADRPSLVIAVNKLPRGLEPAVRTGNVDVRVTYSIFDTLIRRDFLASKQGNASKLKPGLATSWKRISPTTLELELRKGVKFHNGDAFTADDVLFTFSKDRVRGKKAAIPGGRRYFDNIDKVEKLSDHKVRFITKKPDLVLEQRLSSYSSWIVNKNAYYKFKADGEAAAKAEMAKMKAAAAAGEKKKKKKKGPKPHWMNLAIKERTWAPIGTGPYKFKDWKSGDYVALVANDNYFLGKPAAKAVTFKLVPEVSARIAGLVSGEYDMIVEIPPDQLAVLKRYKDIKTKSVVLDNSHVIVFNTKHKVMKDKKIRQALSLAIDRQKLIDALWGGKTFTPNGHQLPAFGKNYDKTRVGYRYDPAEAKKLLKASSYKGEPVSYRFIPGYYTNSTEAAQIIQEMWKSIGFKIKLEPVENFKAVRAKGAAIYPWSNTYRYPDPAGAIYVLWGPKAAVQRKYKFWKAPDSFNNAMEEMLGSGDTSARSKIFQKSLDIFEDEMPGTLLYNPIASYGLRKGVEFTPYSLYFMDLRPDNLKITAKN
jgi:peptide/nickel transport system substrate-binding protein